MNKEMMLKVADAIESETLMGEPYGFNMKMWYSNHATCGTAACVAGWAVALTEKKRLPKVSDMVGNGCKILGLKGDEAHHLFGGHSYGMVDGMSLSRINDDQRYVPNALRWMAATGKVDWNEALYYAKENHDRIEECRKKVSS